MKHIEVGPYKEDPKREAESPVNEQERAREIIRCLKNGEGYLVMQGRKFTVKNGKGETQYFGDLDAMDNLEKERDAIIQWFDLYMQREERKKKESVGPQKHPDQHNSFVKRPAYGEDEKQGQ